MKRKVLALALALMLVLSGCGGDTPHTEGTGPGRMVRRIEVAIHPADPDFSRIYVTQENMNELLALLRSMNSEEKPEQTPDLDGGQSYYTATVTFANGQQSVYYLLGHTYLRLGEEDWSVVDTELSLRFVEFIRSHSTDDGSVSIEPTAVATESSVPTETTAPAETTAPTE